MPRVSVWLVRSSLACLVLGFTVGGAMLAGKGLAWHPFGPGGVPAHVELVVVGWMVQLAMGVALWILPRFGVAAPERGLRLGWLAWGLLNSGIALVVAADLTRAHGVVAFAGRLMETGAAAAFAAAAWRRIRASGLSAM